MSEKKKLFLLDAMALIYRAHFALSKNPRISSKGTDTGAIMGFTNTLLEIITKEKPSHIGVAFDTSAPTFRHVEYPEYKATRQSMPEEIRVAIPYCKDIVKGFNIPIIELDGYEADDLIGTLAKKAARQDFEVYMMTPDKDYAQLVEEHIFLYKPAYMGNAVDIWGIPEVLKKFDIENVDQVRDVLGLKGDSVDNIPGIPGVGDKTASKLLKEFGTVENIVANADQLKGALKKKIEENGEQGIFSKKLATIEIESPFEFSEEQLAMKEPIADILNPIFEELELRTIGKRVFGDQASNEDSGQLGLFGAAEGGEAGSSKETLEDRKTNYHLVADVAGRKELIRKLSAVPEFCFDTETTSLQSVEAELVGISFSVQKGEAWFVTVPENREEAQAIANEFKELFEDENTLKIGQNLKYDMQVLRNYGITLKGKIFDTMLAHYLIDPETAHNMDVLAENYLNYTPVSYSELVGTGKKQKSLREIDPEDVKNYACEDADITLQLKEKLEPEIKEFNLGKLLHEVEEPLSYVLADMEYEGVHVDEAALAEMSKELEKESLRAQTEIFEIAGQEFNIGSPKQLGEILFNKLKLVDKPKKTKSGQFATGEDILSKLANEHEIASKILEFREYQKLKSTYVDALPKLISKVDGRIHTDYRQTIAATGRLSSNNPNLQNIPIRTEKGREIRKAFIPRGEDYRIMAADYSQIELRIMAAFSGDESMTEAFKNGVDIHANTASKVFKVALDDVEPNMRRKAKEVNFGIIYGISAFGLSQNLGISRGEASEIIEAYFTEFPKVKAYMDEVVEKARKQEYVETILGRRRYLRNINAKNFTMRGFAERNAINAPIQGSAADMIKVAMIKVHDWMKQENLKSKMIMQVHDELVFDAHESELELLTSKVDEFMKTAIEIDVPMEIGIGTGTNWLQAH
ncbi:DNA polymerase I [Marinoscillum furvescens]|uniref:DNA polymerase I n=1 Tax=Marinoscillum furvescens DSM 4134 TaxID=1122208 RepID=A0A3D9KXS7_MARFU|nr:DNA polymerase I [Marinoscillum furvescens]RED94064.1 DNA polymerase I [Marinoscillum furvescens DSM 4134]